MSKKTLSKEAMKYNRMLVVQFKVLDLLGFLGKDGGGATRAEGIANEMGLATMNYKPDRELVSRCIETLQAFHKLLEPYPGFDGEMQCFEANEKQAKYKWSETYSPKPKDAGPGIVYTNPVEVTRCSVTRQASPGAEEAK
jgi:hypothetical protein